VVVAGPGGNRSLIGSWSHAWATGTSWSDLIANTSLDEGDVVRSPAPHPSTCLAQGSYAEAISGQLRTKPPGPLRRSTASRSANCRIQRPASGPATQDSIVYLVVGNRTICKGCWNPV